MTKWFSNAMKLLISPWKVYIYFKEEYQNPQRLFAFRNVDPHHLPPPIFTAVLFLLSMIKQAVYQQNKILIRTLRYKKLHKNHLYHVFQSKN